MCVSLCYLCSHCYDASIVAFYCYDLIGFSLPVFFAMVANWVCRKVCFSEGPGRFFTNNNINHKSLSSHYYVHHISNLFSFFYKLILIVIITIVFLHNFLHHNFLCWFFFINFSFMLLYKCFHIIYIYVFFFLS